MINTSIINNNGTPSPLRTRQSRLPSPQKEVSKKIELSTPNVFHTLSTSLSPIMTTSQKGVYKLYDQAVDTAAAAVILGTRAAGAVFKVSGKGAFILCALSTAGAVYTQDSVSLTRASSLGDSIPPLGLTALLTGTLGVALTFSGNLIGQYSDNLSDEYSLRKYYQKTLPRS